MRFNKSQGVNASEMLLAKLCERSFLTLWSYPNVYRKAGKELIDLMVVFGNEIILFSDKSSGYPDSGDPSLDWSRWFRRAISKSTHSLRQAERWLHTQPARLFLNANATKRLPLRLPDISTARIHRVCVATGAADFCKATTGRAGLSINVDVTDDEMQLAVGRVSNIEGWVHVFDESSLDILLSELNTITDFINYLVAKIELFENNNFKGPTTETDLLAVYLWHDRSFPNSDRPIYIEDNLWAMLEASSAFQAGRAENEISYFWDGLIEHLTEHFIDRTLEVGNELEVSDYERIVRIMASETRFYRRVLSRAILQRAELARNGKIGTLMSSEQEGVVYALLIGKGAPKDQYEAYRKDRSQELVLRCHAAKAAQPECRFVIGIALDARGVRGSSEDFVYLDTEEWTLQDLEMARRIQSECEFYLPGVATETRMQEDEYPDR